MRSARFGPIPVTPPQTARLLLDDVKDGIAEGAHQLLCVNRPDAVDHTRAEILFDPLGRCRRRGLEERGSELHAVGAVIDPDSARLDELAGRDHRCVTENGDQVVLTAGFDAQHAEPVLFIVERDALDEAGEDLGWCARPGRLHHHPKMNVEICTCYRDRAPSPMPVGAVLDMSALRQRKW
jgi:hypothetical protein